MNSQELEIEIGAGFGHYGNKFLRGDDSKITEPDKEKWTKNTSISNYVTDFVGHGQIGETFRDKKFNRFVMCNPYEYGFQYASQALDLLKNIIASADRTVRIEVIGHKLNRFASFVSIKTIFNDAEVKSMFQEQGLKFEVNEVEMTDAELALVYYQSDGQNATKPNQKTIIHVEPQ